jgi:hypothetical protein
MATIVYRNAKVFINDVQLDASLSELAVEYSAEMLDVTTFGADTRIHKGGLFTGRVTAKGYFDLLGATGLEAAVFGDIGLDDAIVTVFADGITEGSITLAGFGMKGVVSELKVGNPVGSTLDLSLVAESRGIAA